MQTFLWSETKKQRTQMRVVEKLVEGMRKNVDNLKLPKAHLPLLIKAFATINHCVLQQLATVHLCMNFNSIKTQFFKLI